MIDLQYQVTNDPGETPIFEAIASAWFREDADGGNPNRSVNGPASGPTEWEETPSDVEWREAAARVAQPDPLPVDAVRVAPPAPGQPAGAATAQPHLPVRRAGRAGPGPGARPPEHLPARAARGPAPGARPRFGPLVTEPR